MHLITYLTRIQFGAGAVRAVADELALLGAKAPLIVTDGGVVAAGLVERVIEAAGLARRPPVFDATPENPTEAAAVAARDMFRAEGCDSIVAVGGGSPLDLAKAVPLLATHAEPQEQYAAILGGIPRIRADKLPVIAAPTTAGTGSEVGHAALNRELGLPRNLREMGVPPDCLLAMAAGAVRDHSSATNPRPMREEDYAALFAEAMDQ